MHAVQVDRWVLLVILALVAAQRLLELVVSNRNTAALLARGGVEVAPGHYPLIVGTHVLWLAALAAWAAFAKAELNLALTVVYGLLQFARLWVMSALGPYWTTRIITVPDAPLVHKGPYRLMSHPNYAVVVAEIAVLPLAFGAWPLAIAFSLLNAAVLWVRIGAENDALLARRAHEGQR